MTTTTVRHPLRQGQPSTGSTGSKRSLAIVAAIGVLVTALFIVSRVTTTHHAATTAPVTKISAADAAQIAGDVAPVTVKMTSADAAQVAVPPVTTKLTAADVAQVAGDVAPVTIKLSPADAAQIAR
jgi:hypothetical protein